jgi:hypothetical protein
MSRLVQSIEADELGLRSDVNMILEAPHCLLGWGPPPVNDTTSEDGARVVENRTPRAGSKPRLSSHTVDSR